jgi:hypothetical protein
MLRSLSLSLSLSRNSQQCDLIQFVRDNSREYLCVVGKSTSVDEGVGLSVVWGCGIRKLSSLVEKPL